MTTDLKTGYPSDGYEVYRISLAVHQVVSGEISDLGTGFLGFWDLGVRISEIWRSQVLDF